MPDDASVLSPALRDSHFLRACRGEPSTRTPVWLMRQAGRYMKEYREVRAGRSFLELCKDAALAAEVTDYAQRRIDADAAIIFADILLILEALGLPLDYVAGDGPQFARRIAGAADVAALRSPAAAAADCTYVADAVRLCRARLPHDIPLIGFSGGPFTLAAYAIEGGASRACQATKALMWGEPAVFGRLCGILVEALIPYLRAQVAAGAQVLQIFESWAGHAATADYRLHVLPHLTTLVAALPRGVPVILFGAHSAHLLPLWREAGATVIGCDHQTDLAAAWQSLGGPGRIAIQGNLDPALLLAPRETLLSAADACVAAAGGRPGHIFNLGHGVAKETDVEQVVALIAHVHRRSARPMLG
jgi:uroporphyrinogen decarboxylase